MARILLLACLATLVLASLSGCRNDSGSGQEPPASTTSPRTAKLERARQLIHDCRVRGTVSLHSGVFYLELKNGGRFDVRGIEERTIFEALDRARPRCGPVTISME